MTRGTIYVYRRVNGEAMPLPLMNQSSYREWNGCWSAI